MKNKIIAFVLIVTMGFMAFPINNAEAAPSAGLLRGKFPSSNSGTSDSNRMTDGSDTTFASFAAGGTATYTFSTPTNINGVYYHASGNTKQMSFYNGSTLLLSHSSETSAKTSYNSISVNNVTRIVIENTDAVARAVYEVDVRENPDTTPPTNPTLLTVTAQTTTTANISFTTPPNNAANEDYDKYKIYLDNVLQFTSTAARSKSTLYTHQFTALTNGAHTAKVTSVDFRGNESTGATVNFTTDQTPPNNATLLNISNYTPTNITIGFTTPSNTDFDKYKIYRNDVLINTSEASRAKSTAYTYTDTVNTIGNSYTYKVTTVDTINNESTGTTVLFTPDTTPPANVTGLVVGNATTSTIKIDFITPSTSDFDRYKIYRDSTLINTAAAGRAKNTAYTFTDTGRFQGTDYTYKVTTIDIYNNESAGVTATGSTLPIPETPTGFTGNAGEIGSGEISLAWNPNSPVNLSGYEVYRNGVRINDDLITSENYVDNGLAYGVYAYRIRAVNSYGVVSAYSSTVSIELIPPPDQTPPAVPILSGNPGNEKAQLFWTGNTEPDLAGFNLYRDGAKVNTGLITDTNYMDLGLVNFVTYEYTITSVDTTGNVSAQSATVEVMPEDPDLTPPSIPVDLSATPGDQLVQLSWSANNEYDLAGYNLYRDGVKINTGLLTGSTYTDSSAANNIVYSYRITSVDTHNNESNQSTDITARPQGEITPKNVQANSGTNRMIVTWGAVFNAIEYYVYRGGDLIATVTEAEYTDDNVTLNSSYTYHITALVDGVVSDPSLPATGTVGQVIEFPDNNEGLPEIIAVVLSAFSFAGLFAPYLVLILSLMFAALVIAFIVWLVSKVREKVAWERIKQAELRDLKDPVIIARMKAARERAAEMETTMIERNKRSARSKADRRGTKKLTNREWEKVKKVELTDQRNPLLAARVEATRKELNRATTSKGERAGRTSREERSGRDGRK